VCARACARARGRRVIPLLERGREGESKYRYNMSHSGVTFGGTILFILMFRNNMDVSSDYHTLVITPPPSPPNRKKNPVICWIWAWECPRTRVYGLVERQTSCTAGNTTPIRWVVLQRTVFIDKIRMLQRPLWNIILYVMFDCSFH